MQSTCMGYTMVNELTICVNTWSTLDISMFNNIFRLHAKM